MILRASSNPFGEETYIENIKMNFRALCEHGFSTHSRLSPEANFPRFTRSSLSMFVDRQFWGSWGGVFERELS